LHRSIFDLKKPVDLDHQQKFVGKRFKAKELVIVVGEPTSSFPFSNLQKSYSIAIKDLKKGN
jgi:hypothetical protein